MYSLTTLEINEAIQKSHKGVINNHCVTNTTLQLTDSARSIIRSVATHYSTGTPFEFLLSILGDAFIDVSIISRTNVVGRVTEDQIRSNAAKAIRGERGDWVKQTYDFDGMLEKTVQKFAVEQNGFDAYRFLKASPSDIDLIINAAEEVA